MSNDNKQNHKNSKPEEVIVEPGVRPVHISDIAKGGSDHPSDAMTGGGKVKSAEPESEPVLKSKAGDSDAPSAEARPGAVRESGQAEQGAASAMKAGMAKSSKMPDHQYGTETQSDDSRARPNAVPEK